QKLFERVARWLTYRIDAACLQIRTDIHRPALIAQHRTHERMRGDVAAGASEMMLVNVPTIIPAHELRFELKWLHPLDRSPIDDLRCRSDAAHFALHKCAQQPAADKELCTPVVHHLQIACVVHMALI